MRIRMLNWLAVLALTAVTFIIHADAAHVLVISDGPSHGSALDEQLRDEWEAAGFAVTIVPDLDNVVLPLDFLRGFGAIVLTHVPAAADIYNVTGWNTAATRGPNLQALHDYVKAGGGLFVTPSVAGGGQGVAAAWNEFLEPYGVSMKAFQMRPSADYEPTYAPGEFLGGHPATRGLSALAYPATVLRWDHACSSLPVYTQGAGWQVLGQASGDVGIYAVRDNANVYAQRRADHRTLIAAGPAGEGNLIVSGIQAFYIVSHAYQPADKVSVGEAATGPIAGAVLRGTEAQPSEFGTFWKQALSWLVEESAKHGIGGGTELEPREPQSPSNSRMVDWSTRQPPPSWRHRVMVDFKTNTYDDHPDPMITGELRFFKALVGPRSAYSSGSGTVAEWREAAIAAGYDAIMFAETFEDLTADAYEQLTADCEANSDETLVCLPGIDIEDSQGARYLLLGVTSWPDPSWLIEDGRRILRTNNFSLGFGKSKLVSYHRPGRSPLDPRMIKHFQGITVATYDGNGKRIDDGMYCYQTNIASDSNPIPVAVHELTAPAQVKTAAHSGLQQIMPSDTLHRAVDYFRHAFAHYFKTPVRYFLSEGPILNEWSIFNKDIGSPADGRDRYRIAIGVTSDAPLRSVTLYDGFQRVRQWRPDGNTFSTQVDGRHDASRIFLLVAEDAKGRRVISPGIRTVVRNYRLRCGDRQNWLGTMPLWCIYSGWRQIYGNLSIPLALPPEITGPWNAHAPIFEFPFFGNHMVRTDIDGSKQYIDVTGPVYGDGKPVYAVKDYQYLENQVVTWHSYPPRSKQFASILVETQYRLKRDAEVVPSHGLVASMGVGGKDATLILPDEEPQELNSQTRIDEVPIGTYINGHVVLTPGLRLAGQRLGFPAPPAGTLLQRGTTWQMQYLRINAGSYFWRHKTGLNVPAEGQTDFLRHMGFRGEVPYAFDLQQGNLDGIAWLVDLQADGGGVRGSYTSPTDDELAYNLPLRIHGLSANVPAALWREGQPHLEWFGVHEGTGYVFIDPQTDISFFAGNVVQTNPDLVVELIAWDAEQARLRVHNPTGHPIEAALTTAPIPGYHAVDTTVSVAPGASILIE